MEIKLNSRGETLEEFLAKYDASKYPRPSVALDNVIITEVKWDDEKKRLAILLIKRKDHPAIGRWALPGGFLDIDEELDQGAVRELYEETGVRVDANELIQLGAYGRIGRDPRTRVISIAYLTILPPDSICARAGDDAADVCLFAITDINKNTIELTSCADRQKLRFEYAFKKGKAVFCGEGDLATDHSLIIADALRELEII